MTTRIMLVLLLSFSLTQAKAWRGLVPLHSTRADVQRILGPPSIQNDDGVVYKFETERVSIDYSRGPCGAQPGGWNVPSGTVTSIWITPKPRLLNLHGLNLDLSEFKRIKDDHVEYILEYVNEVQGISYQVDTLHDNTVTLIKYFPAAHDNHLRCPSFGEGLRETTKFDSYPDIPFVNEKHRLDNFAKQVRRYSNTLACILVYGGRRAKEAEAITRAERAKEYLVKGLGIEARRILTIDGGYQEELKVELYLVPPGEHAPNPVPTVDPSEDNVTKCTTNQTPH